MFIWRVWRAYIRHVYMKSLKRIHKTCMSYVFSSNSSYKHVLCILFKLFIYTCLMYSLQTLHINMSYVFSSNSSYKHVLCILFKLFIRVWRAYIGPVYMKSLKRIHRTCLYDEFEENTLDMFIWRVWREYIGLYKLFI
jgi:hypothetical protein